MKKLILLAMCAMPFVSLAEETRTQQLEREYAEEQASRRSDNNVCDFPVRVNGKTSYKTAPCPKGEFMASCTKETKNEKGWTIFESIPCPPGQRKTINQLQNEEESAQKRKCAKDFGAIRIGMSIDRLEECTGAAYVTKTVVKGSMIETYRTMFYWVNVKNGRVISFTERTDN